MSLCFVIYTSISVWSNHTHQSWLWNSAFLANFWFPKDDGMWNSYIWLWTIQVPLTFFYAYLLRRNFLLILLLGDFCDIRGVKVCNPHGTNPSWHRPGTCLSRNIDQVGQQHIWSFNPRLKQNGGGLLSRHQNSHLLFRSFENSEIITTSHQVDLDRITKSPAKALIVSDKWLSPISKRQRGSSILSFNNRLAIYYNQKLPAPPPARPRVKDHD
jgi:hypothetical protein